MKKEDKDQRIENGKKTVLKVLSVAKQMFGRQGFAKTSTSDIVKQAGIARGGLYHHFSTKKEIFKAVFRMTMEEIAEKIKLGTFPTVAEMLQKAMQMGIEIDVCEASKQMLGWEKVDLIPGVKIVGAATLNDLVLDAAATMWF